MSVLLNCAAAADGSCQIRDQPRRTLIRPMGVTEPDGSYLVRSAHTRQRTARRHIGLS